MFKTIDWFRYPFALNRSTKTMLAMRLTIFLLIGFFLTAHAEVNSQTITMSGNNLSIQTVFAEVKKQTGYLVAGRADLIAELGVVSVSVKDMELHQFLELIFAGKPVNYRIEKKTVVLSRKQQVIVTPESLLLVHDKQPIKGLVYSEDGNPLSGVSVVVKKNKKGTITDAQGSFSVQAEMGDLLSISFVGYSSKEVKVTGNTLIISLKVAHSVLDETQVTAYGKTSRRLATGNIGSVKAEEIEKQPVLTALEAIAGRVPGVLISPVSGNAAAPVMVSIRGKNGINPNALSDPLYVIDGVPLSTTNSSPLTGNLPYSMGTVQAGFTNTIGENPLLSINPRDIESISILKDADATAIYGSRGANGVILINTKRAKAGPASFTMSVANGIKMLERFPKLMNTQEYLAVRREAFQNDGIRPNPGNAYDLLSWDTTKYTNWQRELVGTGSYTDINASVGGGTAQSRYRLSANYTDQKEIMNNGGKNIRATFSSDFNHTSGNQKFNFSISNSIALTDVNAYRISEISDLPPNAPDLFKPNGEFNFEPYRIQQNSSVFRVNNLKRPSESKSFVYRGKISLSYEIMKGVTLFTTAGYNFNSNENNLFNTQASYDPMFPWYLSSAIYGKSTSKSWLIEPQLKYDAYIGKGNLSVQLISNLQNEIGSSETINAADFPNDAMMKSHNNGNPLYASTTEGYREYKYMSVSGIVRYAWDNKYIINLNARRDGSSQFGPGKQFGNFGSIGLAWITSDEKWFEKWLPSWFSFLKFRGSYGTTGSAPGANYEYLSRWSKNGQLEGFSSLFNYNDVGGFHVVAPLNQEFQWETTHMKELAVEMGFLKNKINFNVSVYEKSSGNQLTYVPIPSMTGFKRALTNWPAKVRNSGIEFSANAQLFQSKDWSLRVNLNAGRNWNKLVSFPGLETSSYNGQLKVGYSTSTQFLLNYTGIDPLTGSYSFEDRNKDGRVTAMYTPFPTSDLDDRYLIVETLPKYLGGFGFDFSYKGLSVSSQFVFVNKRSQDPYYNYVPGMIANSPLPDEIKNNHWKKPGDQAKYPRYTTDKGQLGPLFSSDGIYGNGSYVKWQNLSIAWQLPDAWISKVKMKNARISIHTQNLLTLSAYKGLDPEVSALSSPIPRTITTSLSFTF